MEIAGAVEGAATIEVGGAISTLGDVLQGFAQNGVAGGVQSGLISVAIDQASSRLTSGLFPGATESTRSAAAALLGEIPDALRKEKEACGGN